MAKPPGATAAPLPHTYITREVQARQKASLTADRQAQSPTTMVLELFRKVSDGG